MHMSDALISTAVGATMLTATVGTMAYSTKKISLEEDSKVPMMGVMGAFIFAAQMINFSIPGTGSSGHLGGGLLLAAILGPEAGFLIMGAVLLIQALFFGDGGLLAYGCNVFNLGFYTCFLAYPLIFKPILRNKVTKGRITAASLISAIVGLQFGAFSVVLETFFSGKTELPVSVFLLLMQPIHLGIGIVEGLATAAVLLFIWSARPEILNFRKIEEPKKKGLSTKKLVGILIVITVLLGGIASWYASSDPDGLEWSILNITGKEIESQGPVQEFLRGIQEKTAILPDYGFKNGPEGASAERAGTSSAGIAGGGITLLGVIGIGLILKRIKDVNRKKQNTGDLHEKE